MADDEYDPFLMTLERLLAHLRGASTDKELIVPTIELEDSVGVREVAAVLSLFPAWNGDLELQLRESAPRHATMDVSPRSPSCPG